MKSIVISAILCFLGLYASAQTKSKTRTPIKKTSATIKSPLKTLADSASYALGVNMAQSLKKDIGDLKIDILISALKSEFNNKPSLFKDSAVTSILKRYSAIVKEQRLAANIKEGRVFLEKNKLKKGIKTTTSGLQYEVLRQGTGGKPTKAETVVCNYRGTFLNGIEFDNSYDRGKPLTIPVGAVIAGWTEGLQLMNMGAKYKFYIPYDLAYGVKGSQTIPGGSLLIFEVELIDIRKAS